MQMQRDLGNFSVFICVDLPSSGEVDVGHPGHLAETAVGRVVRAGSVLAAAIHDLRG